MVRKRNNTPRWARPGRGAVLCAIAVAMAAGISQGCRARPHRPASEPPRVSPVVRGAGSGLEAWWWVVSDQRVQRRVIAKPDQEQQPRVEPPKGPERSAHPDDFAARRVPPEAAPAEADPEQPAEGEEQPPEPAYTVIDDKLDLEVLLAPFADRAVPLPDDVQKRWAASGLRVYAVPQAALYEIEQGLRLVAPVQRQWLGEMPAWTDIAAGPWEERGGVVMVDGEAVRVGPGRLRLIARAWTAPLSGPEGVRPGLRLEVSPQHEPVETEQERLLVAAGLRTREKQRGTTFERLSAGVTLESDDALVIVPVARAMKEDERVEPFREGERLLGEAMLLRAATEDRARARAVIVLVPRIAERFELLGR